jgi:hypothetical protein
MRQKAADAEAAAGPSGASSGSEAPEAAPPNRCSQTWAMLIKRVYEIDPLACPRCGGQMKVVALCEVFDYVKWSHLARRFPWVSGFDGGNCFT